MVKLLTPPVKKPTPFVKVTDSGDNVITQKSHINIGTALRLVDHYRTRAIADRVRRFAHSAGKIHIFHIHKKYGVKTMNLR
jgi:hypothetical protein